MSKENPFSSEMVRVFGAIRTLTPASQVTFTNKDNRNTADEKKNFILDVSIWRVGPKEHNRHASFTTTQTSTDTAEPNDGVEIGAFVCNSVYTKPTADVYCLSGSLVVGYQPPPAPPVKEVSPPRSLNTTEQPVPVYQVQTHT